MSKNVEIYHQQAALFAAQYDALSFEQVHHCWRQYWPQDQWVLDIGAGSGRDALWLAERGCQVIAVEPANDLLQLGQRKTGKMVKWLHDSLPELKSCKQLNLQFNTILLSAVWMHILPTERELALRNMAKLLVPGGRLVVSLRFGDFSDERIAYLVSVDEIAALARQFGLTLCFISDKTADSGGRAKIEWQTLVLELPKAATT